MSAPVSFDAGAFLATYARLDAALVAAGFPSTSPWWGAQLERFFRSGRRRWIVRAGRRAGKSSTLARLAVCWALFGSWFVPPGDVAVVAFVSTSKDEAAARLRTIADVLRALEVSFDQRSDELELRDRRLVFRVFACTTKAVVGFTSIAVFCDECARWESRDDGANPAKEVVSSLAPTLATQEHGFLVLSSSPWGTEDFHHECFEQGDTEHQVTSFGTTWDCNPTLSEERTHELEPDAKTWSREYAGLPSDVVLGDWFSDALDRAIDDRPPPAVVPGLSAIIACDPAFSRDRFGYAAVASIIAGRDAQGRARRVTHTLMCGSWPAGGKPSECAARLKSEVCNVFEVPAKETSHVFSDQFEGNSFAELSRQQGIYLEVVPWVGGTSERSKLARFRSVRVAMAEGQFKVLNDPDLIREFRSVRGVLSPSGVERIEIPRTSKGHGDRVSALVLAGSIALERAAKEPDPPKTERDWAREERQRMIRNIDNRRRREFEDNPQAAVRRAFMGLR